MPNVATALQTIQADIAAYFAAYLPAVSPLPTVFIDKESTTAAANLARGGPTMISIFDLNMSRNTTRWPVVNNQVVTDPTGISSVYNAATTSPSSPANITISGTANANDAISAVFTNIKVPLTYPAQPYSTPAVAWVVYQCTAGDTPTIIAAALAALINASSTCSAVASATASGGVITLTPVGTYTLQPYTKTGNITTLSQEVGRQMRPIRITVWSTLGVQRDLIGGILLGYINLRSSRFGVQCSTGDQGWIRIIPNSDGQGMDTHQTDIYRWDFTINCEFGITVQTILYSVLVEEAQYQFID